MTHQPLESLVHLQAEAHLSVDNSWLYQVTTRVWQPSYCNFDLVEMVGAVDVQYQSLPSASLSLLTPMLVWSFGTTRGRTPVVVGFGVSESGIFS